MEEEKRLLGVRITEVVMDRQREGMDGKEEARRWRVEVESERAEL